MNLLQTPLCHRLGIDLPIVQAPIGSASTAELAAAVANAGGLGMLGLTWTGPDAVRDRLHRVKDLTNRPIGINLSLAFPIGEQLAVSLDAEGLTTPGVAWPDEPGRG
jgi:NAD(P)H-dependent flavin oxidoreductase YrpB (nitropropane dioxygenase family)